MPALETGALSPGSIRLRPPLRRNKADPGSGRHLIWTSWRGCFETLCPMKTQNIRTPRFVALLAFGCFALSPMAQAVNPPPDGGYPGGNTAEGTSALLSLTTGLYNTAVGLYSVLSLTDGIF